MFRLLIQRPGRPPQAFKLIRKVTTIGRGKDTDLLLPDISVSRHHCKIELQGKHLVLVDLGSQNGTKVNGKPIKSKPLKAGDRLQIGKFEVVFEQKVTQKVEGAGGESGVGAYNLEGVRTGFLEKVSAVDGAGAHSTTQISKAELDQVRKMVKVQESGRICVAGQPQTSWLIPKSGIRFGKGGVPADGMGFGGSAAVKWNGKAHQIEKLGGLFFTLTVNGEDVSGARVLKPGDVIMVGKSAFSYAV